MSAPFSHNLTRACELIADRLCAPLAAAEQAELEKLISGLSAAEQDILRREEMLLTRGAAEALAVMMSGDGSVPVSASLRDRLLASGMAQLGQPAIKPSIAPATAPARSAAPIAAPPAVQDTAPSRLALYTGWLLAAASITVAAIIYLNRPAAPITPPMPPVPTIFAQRESLLTQPGTVTTAWSTTPDPAAQGVAGDVSWNASLQKGYLRLKGLAQNDPGTLQYQLWIFDKGRIEPDHAGDLLKQYPIDGGVFDIAAAQLDPATGDYIIPINAKLPVRDVGAFAVTIEQPGGVVVTKRDRLLLLAPIKS